MKPTFLLVQSMAAAKDQRYAVSPEPGFGEEVAMKHISTAIEEADSKRASADCKTIAYLKPRVFSTHSSRLGTEVYVLGIPTGESVDEEQAKAQLRAVVPQIDTVIKAAKWEGVMFQEIQGLGEITNQIELKSKAISGSPKTRARQAPDRSGLKLVWAIVLVVPIVLVVLAGIWRVYKPFSTEESLVDSGKIVLAANQKDAKETKPAPHKNFSDAFKSFSQLSETDETTILRELFAIAKVQSTEKNNTTNQNDPSTEWNKIEKTWRSGIDTKLPFSLVGSVGLIEQFKSNKITPLTLIRIQNLTDEDSTSRLKFLDNHSAESFKKAAKIRTSLRDFGSAVQDFQSIDLIVFSKLEKHQNSLVSFLASNHNSASILSLDLTIEQQIKGAVGQDVKIKNKINLGLFDNRDLAIFKEYLKWIKEGNQGDIVDKNSVSILRNRWNDLQKSSLVSDEVIFGALTKTLDRILEEMSNLQSILQEPILPQ